MAAEDELQSSINKLSKSVEDIRKVADNAAKLAASLSTANNTVQKNIESELQLITVNKKNAVQAQKSITQSIANQTALINTAKLEQAASEQLAAQKFKQGQSIAAELNDNATQIEKQRAAMENSTVDQLRFQQRSMEGLENTQSKLQAAMKNNEEAYDKETEKIKLQNDRIEEASKEIQRFEEEEKLLRETTRELAAAEQQLTINLKQQNDPFKKLKTKLEGPVAGELLKLADGLKNLTDSIYKTQQRFGVSFDTAASLYKDTLINSAKSFLSAATGKGPFVSQEEILAAGQSFTKQFGTVLQPEEMNRIAREAKALGVSSDVYVNAKRAFLGTGNEEATRMRAMSEFKKNGLSAGQALQFAADNADLLAVAGEKYSDSLFRAAAESKKIGVNLRDIEKFANSVVGDFEGSLENFAELSALGVEMDFNQLAQVAATGTTDEMKDVLSQQLSMSGITGEELQRNRQVRLALTQTTGLDEASILRLAGVVEEPKEPTLDENQLSATTENTTALGVLTQSFGALGGIFSSVVGTLLTVVTAASTIYQFILNNRLQKIITGPLTSGGAGGGLVPPAIPGTKIPPTPPAGGGAALGGAAQGASKFSVSSVLRGAAAMLVVAASVYVLAKGLQEFNTVKWESLAMAGTAVAALGVGIAYGGPLISTGLSALANPKALIGLGAITLALLGIGAAMRLAAPAFQAFGTIIKATFDGISTLIETVSSSISKLLSVLQTVPNGKLALIGLELIPFSVGLAALGAAAQVAAPGLAVLGGLALVGTFVGRSLGLLPTTEGQGTVGKGKAAGGLITGPGTSTSDNILTPSSPGEFVVNAKATQAYGSDMLNKINTGTYTPEKQIVTNNTKIDTTRLEEKLDKLINRLSGMKVEMNGYEVGHVSFNEARTPLRVR